METILALDHHILTYIAAHLQSDLMTAVMRFFTALGNAGFIWIALGIALLFFPKTRRFGIALLAALAVGALLSECVLKPLVQRARPFVRYPDLVALIAPPQDFSFPSGHATSSFAAAAVLFAAKKPVGMLAFCGAAAIAFSRLYLCVHFPTDVLAGALLGTAVGICTAVLVRKLAERIHYAKLR